MSEAAVGTSERHASWLELFFDLVVVVAVAQLAHLLHGGPGIGKVGLFVLLYYAVWSVWTSFTLYANVAGGRTRARSMLLAMFGIAVMAASIPEVTHDRGAVFAIAYVVCKWLAMGTWRRTGTILTAWPAAQLGAGFVPWVISIWVEPPARYWLWAVGIALEIGLSMAQGRNPAHLLAEARAKEEFSERARITNAARKAQRGRPQRREREPLRLIPAVVDGSHLRERLGLFIIIVLGEAVAQVVGAAAEVEWSRALWFTALAGFGLLVCLWWLALAYGSSAVPIGTRQTPPWLAIPAHFAMTLGITATAAGLGSMAEHPDGHMGTSMRWILCGGMALYFATLLATGVATKAPAQWIVGFSVPAVALPLLLGLAGGALPAWTLAVGLLAAAGWQAAYPKLAERQAARLSGEVPPGELR
ncbi:low temperature requirement protein LtrA [Allocatelliglobosispora scoriae]|uniref:Low temperature requirement protein LtrA n=1 Tax=Allocatelliglobosispora scoriae TaxID=643052 RepID=A0A841C1X9_9ACTN|nr:low temperature requirement protein A [Allocatelliglobosispora scoriae]MBB5873935.1 low temperature requirement protein LtrA [Allocatelliglobosispora scoriae]